MMRWGLCAVCDSELTVGQAVVSRYTGASLGQYVHFECNKIPVFGTVTVDNTGVIEDWQPTLNLRWKQHSYSVPAGYLVKAWSSTLQQLWHDTKAGKQEWRDIPEVRE
jgi:hypothetical protein